MPATILDILLATFAVSLIIVVHEFGHLVMAKAVGMRVEVFSIGFWKRIVGFKWGGTDYRISLLPLGGYVKVTGEMAEGDEETSPDNFMAKTPGQRALYVIGGVTMNFILAVVLFVIAYSVGVPLEAAEVGDTAPGGPAWMAGLKPGDRIVAVDDVEDPVFKDIVRAVALGGRDSVELRVQRDERTFTVDLSPQYSKRQGYRVVGIVPAYEPVVTGLAADGSPASEAGIEIGDRIVSVNGEPVETAQEVELRYSSQPGVPLTLLVERGEKTLTLEATPIPAERYMIGVSGASSKVTMVEPTGPAREAGLRPGDRIVAVNGVTVASAVGLEAQIRRNFGEVRLEVAREGETREVELTVEDGLALVRFLHSVVFDQSARLSWVSEDGPAWNAGMRPGDLVVRVAGDKVTDWEGISSGLAAAGRDEVEVSWTRDGETFTARIKPQTETAESVGQLGIAMDKPKMVSKRYGVIGAVRAGFRNTYETLGEIFLTIKGFATRRVSPKTVGGIITIAHVSFLAARLGIPRLIHLTAMISAAVGFMNILPIPVLDGGYLVLLAIEKIRGKRLEERFLAIAQSVGLVLILALAVYVTWNDILRLLNLG